MVSYDGEYYVCDGTWSFKVPEDAKNLRFTDAEAFKRAGSIYFKSVEKVIVPDGVTELCLEQFSGCTNLKNVYLPDTLKVIGDKAFCYCLSLESIHIPKGVNTIGDSAFINCQKLKEIQLPDSVKSIESYAFYNCKSLRELKIPENVCEIGDEAFMGCVNLQKIKIPEGIQEIKEGTFFECSGLKEADLPGTLRKIGNTSFYGCVNLQNIKIPEGVQEIENGAFRHCEKIKEIQLPDTLKVIGRSAFSICSSLENINIPNGVEISDRAFQDCESLETVVIPNGVRSLEDAAFMGCSNLKKIELSDDFEYIMGEPFDCIGVLEEVLYKGINVKPYLDAKIYGFNNFDVIKKLVDNDIKPDMNLFEIAVDREHADKLNEFIKDYQMYGLMDVSRNMRVTNSRDVEQLKNCFKENRETGKVIPKCLDKLALLCNAVRIKPEDIVKSFDIKYTSRVIKEHKPFIPAIACRCYYPKDICGKLIDKNLDSLMAEAVSLYNTTNLECYRHAMDFIVSHTDTNQELLKNIVISAQNLQITPGTTLESIKQKMAKEEALGERNKIEKRYGLELADCECWIPVMKTEYHGRTARILNFKDPDDLTLAANLGDLTNCCQHLGGAGESAMMHGFLNPYAGFFVIEDENKKILAQAEIWLADGNTLVFDNIEFAHTADRDYDARIDELRGDLALFASKSIFPEIIMGCGYNEIGYELMKKAPIPDLKLTPFEIYKIAENEGIWEEFDEIKDAVKYMCREDYDPYDVVYSDAEDNCVYIKHDNKVSEYLKDGADIEIRSRRTHRGNAVNMPETLIDHIELKSPEKTEDIHLSDQYHISADDMYDIANLLDEGHRKACEMNLSGSHEKQQTIEEER